MLFNHTHIQHSHSQCLTDDVNSQMASTYTYFCM